MEIDIQKNRRSCKYSISVQVKRVLWSFGKILFRLIPHPLYASRCVLLRLFGAKIGKEVHIYNSAEIYFPWNLEVGDYGAIGEKAYIYNLGRIVIGVKATVSHRAHLCAGTHDFCNSSLPLLKPPIVIEDQVWVCADAFVGPNVVVGEGEIVGARAVVTKNVEPWSVVVGNPAKIIKMRVIKV
jgi:putative colanic acid biosynthesis acetyltransferase WcaF